MSEDIYKISPATQKNRRTFVHFSKSTQSNLNKIFSIVLVIFLALAPIPFGSNRPVFWALSGVALSSMTLTYLMLLYFRNSKLRNNLTRLKASLILYIILLIFITIQIIPFGDWLKPFSIKIDDLVISSNSLSLSPSMSLLSLIQFASYGLLFFLILQISHNTERARFLLKAIFLIITVYAAYSIFALTQLNDSILFMDKWAYNGVATATFINRNSFATFLAFGLIIGIAFSVAALLPNDDLTGQQKSPLSSLLFGLGSAIIMVALLATQSRMGFAAGISGAVVTLILVFSKTSKSTRLIWSVTIIGFLGLSALFTLYGSGLLERLGSTESLADGRLALYTQVIDMISTRPWLGFGAGSFELVFPLFHQLPLSPDLVWDKAHNTYLALWSELGIIFGSIPIILVIIYSRIAWQIYRTTKRRWLHSAIMIGVITTTAIHSLVDFSLEIHAVAFIFCAIMALGISGSTRSITEKDNV